MSYQFWLQLIKKYPERFIIAVLITIVLILIQKSCQPEPRQSINIHPIPKDRIKIKTTYVPVPVKLPDHFPDLSKMVDTVFIHDKPKLIVADTPAAIKEFISKHAYLDTIYSGQFGYVVLLDTLQFNRIMHRQKMIDLKPVYRFRPVTRKIYIGIGIGGYADKFGIAGKVLYIDKKQHAFEYSYNPVMKYHELSAFFLIRFKSKRPP